MSLTLHYHPLSSYCWKALIGLYELGVPFEKNIVDLGDDQQRSTFRALWPIGKFPVLRDEARHKTIPESSIVLEYAQGITTSGKRLIPNDPALALECRFRDRVIDAYIHQPMQAIVADRLRAEGTRDSISVAAARAQIATAYGVVEGQLEQGPWSLGAEFTLVDCSAMPALYYADKVAPLDDRFPKTKAYLAALVKRPSVARVLDEAAPYFAMFPG